MPQEGNKMRYQIHISISGNAMLELEAASELDAEIEAQAWLDADKVGWAEYNVDITAISV